MKTVVVSLLTAILLVSSGVAYAQNGEDIPDAEGCTDHPFVIRMKGYIISMCYELTAPGPILIDKGGLKTTEIGTRKTDHNYFYLANIEYEDQPTHKEVLEHYKRLTPDRTRQESIAFTLLLKTAKPFFLSKML